MNVGPTWTQVTGQVIESTNAVWTHRCDSTGLTNKTGQTIGKNNRLLDPSWTQNQGAWDSPICLPEWLKKWSGRPGSNREIVAPGGP